MITSREMAKIVCDALADKKGEDIRAIDISKGTLAALGIPRPGPIER